jgi:hypothetical protein
MNGLASLLRYQMGGPVGYVDGGQIDSTSTKPYLIDLQMMKAELIMKHYLRTGL